MRTLGKLTAQELRLFRREPAQVFFTVLFPALLVVILGAVPDFREPVGALGGLRIVDVYVAIAVVMALGSLGLQVAPPALATYRERGVLRRLAATPVRPAALLAAQLLTNLLAAVAAIALVLVTGRILYAVALPRQPVAYLVAFLACAGTALVLGLVIAAVAPSGKAANSIGTLVFFPLMFFAGLWTPREVFPEVLRRISDFTPFGAGERALVDAMTGSWPAWDSLTVLVAYILVAGLAAARLFRWS
ncbi:ABC transporter permease [Symbioplanes lichenis]|uniref:ABC transporter permease n=1 Tax=Symbioplanes lichenis TaxID=1629072 RepID=UPI0027392CCC|nr:ABC transporter permease [Actinoplanes lichenis]